MRSSLEVKRPRGGTRRAEGDSPVRDDATVRCGRNQCRRQTSIRVELQPVTKGQLLQERREK